MKFKYIKISVIFSVVLVLAVSLLVAPALSGDKYPSKPIKLIVPYGPGGATDLAARVLVSVIPEYLEQAVVVVNVAGAGGSVGFDAVRTAKPDGYTMMMNAIGANVLVPAKNTKLPFSYDEMTYIARTQINPNVLIVNKNSPYKTFKDLAAALKSNPGKLKYSTAGVANVTDLGPSILLKELGLPDSAAVAVHYDSDNAALLALLQGESDFVQGNLAPFASAIKGGQVTPLAMTTPERVVGFENIPTFTELGYPGISIVGWRGVSGPKGLAPEIVKVWEAAVEKTCQSKSWIKLVKKLGDEPGFMGTQQYNDFVNADFKRYRELFTELDLLIK
jgi:tripartite-type tricarboxylate transporter receptor subunit TctC